MHILFITSNWCLIISSWFCCCFTAEIFFPVSAHQPEVTYGCVCIGPQTVFKIKISNWVSVFENLLMTHKNLDVWLYLSQTTHPATLDTHFWRRKLCGPKAGCPWWAQVPRSPGPQVPPDNVLSCNFSSKTHCRCLILWSESVFSNFYLPN